MAISMACLSSQVVGSIRTRKRPWPPTTDVLNGLPTIRSGRQPNIRPASRLANSTIPPSAKTTTPSSWSPAGQGWLRAVSMRIARRDSPSRLAAPRQAECCLSKSPIRERFVNITRSQAITARGAQMPLLSWPRLANTADTGRAHVFRNGPVRN